MRAGEKKKNEWELLSAGTFLNEGEKENKRRGDRDMTTCVEEKNKKKKKEKKKKRMDEMKWEKGEII